MNKPLTMLEEAQPRNITRADVLMPKVLAWKLMAV